MLNKLLKNIHKNLDNYFIENEWIKRTSKKEMNLVLDTEVSPNENLNEAITYSIALMSCDNNKNLCYKYNNVDECLNMLLNIPCEKINIYVHNLFYDIKPFIISFIQQYGNNPIKDDFYQKEVFNIFKKEKEKIKVLKNGKSLSNNKYEYSLCLKKGQLYGTSFFGNTFINEKGKQQPVELSFKDTFKIVPYSLQKCCTAFIDLNLPKDNLDYNKVRNINDELTKDEKIYIYNDVFGLSHLVKKLIIDGFFINGKKVQYTKITNSSQSLYDYKISLMEDFIFKQNTFSDKDFYENIETQLLKTSFYTLNDNQYDIKLNILFSKIFPPQNYFEDGWIRHSYYGGLSTVDFNNVNKFSKLEIKKGYVLDVNSLYPWIMQDKLLPFGYATYDKNPYRSMNKDYKKNKPLYIQEITIYDFKLKKGKMAFVQVKDNVDFNGREVIEENINLKGEKVSIKLILCNPLFDLLFENYNIKSYKLGCHLAFQGANNLFKNYLDYWGQIKKTSKGANREIAKLRQNALYGKFGSSGDNEITNIVIDNGKFKVEHTHDGFTTDNIYVAMSSFITSYAKQYLVNTINQNRENFLYCDTDSCHLFGLVDNVKGVELDSKKYGAWDYENAFNDFRYIGPKRYAENCFIQKKWKIKGRERIVRLKGKTNWEIKCCGLNDSIMKKVKDIDIFTNCEYTSKELKKIKIYTNNDSIYYYKDKNMTIKIKGLIKSKKAKIVKGGTLIIEQPYMINGNKFVR